MPTALTKINGRKIFIIIYGFQNDTDIVSYLPPPKKNVATLLSIIILQKLLMIANVNVITIFLKLQYSFQCKKRFTQLGKITGWQNISYCRNR